MSGTAVSGFHAEDTQGMSEDERALHLYRVLKSDPGVPPDYEIQKKSERLMKLLGELKAATRRRE